jgi:KipI family sensor histidine kinase inhibitor
MAAVPHTPLIVPLGDAALLVRFGDTLDEAANRAAIAFAQRTQAAKLPEVLEAVPNLVSVLIRFDPAVTEAERLAAEIRLLLAAEGAPRSTTPRHHVVPVSFGGDEGPDLDEVAAALGLAPTAFVAAHNNAPLRVLAIGFAPGFAYCGFHPETLRVPRRTSVRHRVPAGSILFAAGQTAVAATAIPTGWHVIGRTTFSNFDPLHDPPMTLRPGDSVSFETVA